MRGRYYFSPANTPFVQGATLFGSRNWDGTGTITGDEPPGSVPVVLGEVRGQPQRWDSGALPVVLPAAVAVGDPGCLLNGESIADATPASEIDGGFVAGCYLPQQPPNPDLEFGFTVWSCPTQLFWIQQIDLLYNNENADVVTNCTRRFAGATITIVKKTTLYPQYVLVVNPSYACVAACGTDNLAQVLIQALQGFSGPQDFGVFSTGNLWYQFADNLIAALDAQGALDGRPLLFAGHSYGGASAMIAAARLALAQPKTEIRYITYGAPKPGDARLRDLLDLAFDGVSLANDGDFISALPPSADVLEAMSSVGPFGVVLGWTRWQYPPQTTLLYQAQLLKNTYQRFDSRSLVAYISAVIATGSLATVPAHASSAYFNKIRLRCAGFLPTPVVMELGWNVSKTVTSVILPPCCPSGVNQVLHVSISGCTGGSAVYNGATGSAGWSGILWQWNVSILTVDGLMQPPLSCNAGFGWSLAISFGVWILSGAAIGNACIPFSITGTLHGPRGTSGITFNFTN